jgi:hypothetical protein
MRILQRSMLFWFPIALLITGCATTKSGSTKLTSAWVDPTYLGQPGKIMIIGIARNPVNKKILEDEFVLQLRARKTDAVASYTVMPEDKQDDQDVIDAKMKEQGADVVLISRLASKKTVYTYVPGSVTYPPSNYGNWRNYYGYGLHSAREVFTPGYTTEDEYALIETNLYDVRDNKLIWSASSETEVMGSDRNQISSYIRVMVNAMADEKLLGGK